MFGGIGFMLNGNLLAGASQRGLLIRVGKEQQQWHRTYPLEISASEYLSDDARIRLRPRRRRAPAFARHHRATHAALHRLSRE